MAFRALGDASSSIDVPAADVRATHAGCAAHQYAATDVRATRYCACSDVATPDVCTTVKASLAATITAGGINPVAGFPAPSQSQANKIRIPICIFHGSDDTTVPPERSKLLEEVLRTNNVPCDRHLFPGIGHDLHRVKEKDVNAAIEKWFQKYAPSR